MTAISSEALIANALVGSNLVMTCAVVEARLRQALIDLCGDQKQKSVCNKMLLLKKNKHFHIHVWVLHTLTKRWLAPVSLDSTDALGGSGHGHVARVAYVHGH